MTAVTITKENDDNMPDVNYDLIVKVRCKADDCKAALEYPLRNLRNLPQRLPDLWQ